MPYLSATATSAGESAGFVDIVVTLDTPSTNSVSVTYDALNATANYHSSTPDFQRVNGTLVFAPGETSKTVRVNVVNNTLVESTELLWFELSAPVNATVVQRLTPVLLVDNDATAGTPAISVSDALVDETARTASFFVTLNKPSTLPVGVNFATAAHTDANTTATAGSDFGAASGLLSFAPGEVVKTVTVPIINDSAQELDEYFTVQLSNPSNGALADASGLGNIAANDAPPAGAPYVTARALVTDETSALQYVVIELSAPSTNEVRIDFDIQNGSANYHSSVPDFQRVNGTLVFAPGVTAMTVAMPVIGDTAAEGTELAWVVLDTPVNASVPQRLTPIFFFDNDATAGVPALSVSDPVVDEGAGRATFVVWMNKPSIATVTVGYATADETTSTGGDYRAATGMLTFAPGEVVKTVTVDLVNDGAAEQDEFFTLKLINPGNATLADDAGRATIGANDAAPAGMPIVFVRPVAADESMAAQQVVVQLSAPSGNEVRVNFDMQNATGNYHSSIPDFQRHNGTLVFAPGETTKVVNMPITGNTLAEARELVWFVLDTPVNAVVPQQLWPVWLHDNDGTAGTPVASVTDAVVDERAGYATFFVSLDRPATNLVSVAWATADETTGAGADYRAASGTLQFAPGETVKAVTIDIHDDGIAEPDEYFRLQLGATSGATLGDAVGGAVIGRNDTALVSRPQVNATPLTIGEADTAASFMIQLSAPSMNEVRVNFDFANGTANYHSSLPDFQRHNGTLVFAPGETTKVVVAPLTDDTSAEGLETFSLNLSTPVNATIGQAQVSVTLVDDDSGAKVFSGGFGNDQYTVTSALDRIAESPRGGTDTVRSSVSYTLPDNVERLVLTGSATNGIGNAAHNVFRGNAGNNTFDGGAGVDTAVFSGPRASYSYGGSTEQRTVTGGGEGSDTLYSIERLQFSDTVLAGDTSPGQNTYLVYAMLNAGFDSTPLLSELSRWVAYLDRQGSTLELAQAMISYYAPGVPDDALVAHLWSTIVETPIPLDALMLYSGLVADGTFTQASLLDLVATLDLNTVEIAGIVGQPVVLDPAFFAVPG
jgi:hypothetical protein